MRNPTADSRVLYPEERPYDQWPRTYPYLGMSKDEAVTVLFTAKDTGFVVWFLPVVTAGGRLARALGEHSENWDERSEFYVFRGSVDIKNYRGDEE